MGVLCALVCLVCAGCIAQPKLASDANLASAPPLAGTLYVVHPAAHLEGAMEVEVRHNGAIVQRPSVLGMLLARDAPATRVPIKVLSLGGRRCEPMAISPHGRYVACLRADEFGMIAVYQRDRPAATLRNTAVHISFDTHHMAGFTSEDRLAVAGDDRSCAAYYRTDAHVYAAEPRARLFVIDAATAKTVRSGPCIHGVVAAAGAIVYIGHDDSEEPQFSRDGRLWQPGLAVALDGDGNVLAIDKHDRLVDEQNRLVAADVVDAVWTR